jgi:putative lipoic acid-binding regulatory protein
MSDDSKGSVFGVGEHPLTEDVDAKADDRKVCGIVMPIAAMGEEYSEAHWSRVRRILQRAIDRAGLRSQLVWENPEVDVIQTAILQNIFENDVVICDVSNLNPNVMLETGLRLSTKRPTIIVTDRIKRPPFDISTISYIEYPRDLEYNATEDFISKLTRKIVDVIKAAEEDRYKPYIEQFRFETVQPSSVTVTTDEYVRERLDELTGAVRKIMRSQEQSSRRQTTKTPTSNEERVRNRTRLVGAISGVIDRQRADKVEKLIDAIPGTQCIVSQNGNDNFNFEIYTTLSGDETENIMIQCEHIITNHESDYLLS